MSEKQIKEAPKTTELLDSSGQSNSTQTSNEDQISKLSARLKHFKQNLKKKSPKSSSQKPRRQFKFNNNKNFAKKKSGKKRSKKRAKLRFMDPDGAPYVSNTDASYQKAKEVEEDLAIQSTETEENDPNELQRKKKKRNVSFSQKKRIILIQMDQPVFKNACSKQNLKVKSILKNKKKNLKEGEKEKEIEDKGDGVSFGIGLSENLKGTFSRRKGLSVGVDGNMEAGESGEPKKPIPHANVVVRGTAQLRHPNFIDSLKIDRVQVTVGAPPPPPPPAPAPAQVQPPQPAEPIKRVTVQQKAPQQLEQPKKTGTAHQGPLSFNMSLRASLNHGAANQPSQSLQQNLPGSQRVSQLQQHPQHPPAQLGSPQVPNQQVQEDLRPQKKLLRNLHSRPLLASGNGPEKKQLPPKHRFHSPPVTARNKFNQQPTKFDRSLTPQRATSNQIVGRKPQFRSPALIKGQKVQGRFQGGPQNQPKLGARRGANSHFRGGHVKRMTSKKNNGNNNGVAEFNKPPQLARNHSPQSQVQTNPQFKQQNFMSPIKEINAQRAKRKFKSPHPKLSNILNNLSAQQVKENHHNNYNIQSLNFGHPKKDAAPGASAQKVEQAADKSPTANRNLGSQNNLNHSPSSVSRNVAFRSPQAKTKRDKIMEIIKSRVNINRKKGQDLLLGRHQRNNSLRSSQTKRFGRDAQLPPPAINSFNSPQKGSMGSKVRFNLNKISKSKLSQVKHLAEGNGVKHNAQQPQPGQNMAEEGRDGNPGQGEGKAILRHSSPTMMSLSPSLNHSPLHQRKKSINKGLMNSPKMIPPVYSSNKKRGFTPKNSSPGVQKLKNFNNLNNLRARFHKSIEKGTGAPNGMINSLRTSANNTFSSRTPKGGLHQVSASLNVQNVKALLGAVGSKKGLKSGNMPPGGAKGLAGQPNLPPNNLSIANDTQRGIFSAMSPPSGIAGPEAVNEMNMRESTATVTTNLRLSLNSPVKPPTKAQGPNGAPSHFPGRNANQAHMGSFQDQSFYKKHQTSHQDSEMDLSLTQRSMDPRISMKPQKPPQKPPIAPNTTKKEFNSLSKQGRRGLNSGYLNLKTINSAAQANGRMSGNTESVPSIAAWKPQDNAGNIQSASKLRFADGGAGKRKGLFQAIKPINTKFGKNKPYFSMKSLSKASLISPRKGLLKANTGNGRTQPGVLMSPNGKEIPKFHKKNPSLIPKGTNGANGGQQKGRGGSYLPKNLSFMANLGPFQSVGGAGGMGSAPSKDQLRYSMRSKLHHGSNNLKNSTTNINPGTRISNNSKQYESVPLTNRKFEGSVPPNHNDRMSQRGGESFKNELRTSRDRSSLSIVSGMQLQMALNMGKQFRTFDGSTYPKNKLMDRGHPGGAGLGRGALGATGGASSQRRGMNALAGAGDKGRFGAGAVDMNSRRSNRSTSFFY